MDGVIESRARMTPYVFAVALAKLLVMSATFLLEAAGFDLGESQGNGLSIVTIMAGAAWFAYRIDRPMTRMERLRFASGVTLLDVSLSIAVLLVAVLMSGRKLSVQNIGMILSGGRETSIDPVLFLLLIFTEVMTFGASYLFGWIFTRKLPRKRRPDH